MPARSGDDPSTGVAYTYANTTDFDETLAAGFERIAAARPDNVAVISDRWQATYRRLNETANRVAHRLVAGGGAVGDRVAILMEHDTPAIAANVGIVKAGRIAVVLDPRDPLPRLNALVADAEPSIILTDADNARLADGIAGSGSGILTLEPERLAGRADDPPPLADPAQPASLIYTSGATGRPKGVMYTHRQYCRNAAVHSEAMQYSEHDRIPLLSAMSTGQGANVVWYALLNGAALCPFPLRKRGFTGLAEWIVDCGVTVYVSSASVYRTLMETLDRQTVFPDVRAVRLASEAATAGEFRSFQTRFPAASIFVHTLASSESGNIAWIAWPREAVLPDGTLPVGHVSRGIEVMLLGDDGTPVECGEIGEIVVRSRYTAAGYWRNPGLTAERFSGDLDGEGTRLVRTGDEGRFTEGGLLEFCGRKDDRIKIRGNRIELGEVEKALTGLPGIDRAAAVAIPRANREPVLVAFVVTRRGASWSEPRLRHAMAANLPPHMVPSRLVFLESLPLGPGGKVNRETLRDHPLSQPGEKIAAPPQTETESRVADMWAQALAVPDVGRDDDFFGLGGDSLRGAIVAAEIHHAFGAEISLADIAAHSRLSALASLIDQRRRIAAGPPPIANVARNRPMLLSLFQERIWRLSQKRPANLMARSLHIAGPLDVEILKECLRYLVERHESLRTTFGVSDGHPVQMIHPASPLHFSLVDFSSEANPEDHADSFAIKQAAHPIDPARLPTARHFLIRTAPDQHRLLRIDHPLNQDGWSLSILINELAALYEARLNGMAPPFPKEMPVQYVDYALWHREHMRTDGLPYNEMLDWWMRVFSRRIRPLKLPFRRRKPRADVDPGDGVINWQDDRDVGERLDRFARDAGGTHFTVRLACFVGLVADMVGQKTVVLGTAFDNRRQTWTRDIVGQLSSLVPVVFPYEPHLPFRDWVRAVRDCVFAAETRAEIPYEDLYERLRAAGRKPPDVRILFNLSAELAEQRFGNLVLTRRPYPVARMPWGCQIYIDGRIADNCRVDFDAGLYRREGMQAMFERYGRLLAIAAARPELPIGRMVAMSSANRLRRLYADYMNDGLGGFFRSARTGEGSAA